MITQPLDANSRVFALAFTPKIGAQEFDVVEQTRAVTVGRAFFEHERDKIGETVQVAIEDPSPLPWAGQTTKTAVWLRRDGPAAFTAFAVNCTHLACPVNWRQDAELFLCPCHGGTYYASGDVAAGPPPYALNRYPVRVANGQVEIQTSPLPIQ